MTTVTMHEVFGRAGASDSDRPAWLAERRPGITATEIRNIVRKKVAVPTLIAQKLGRRPESDWTGPYAAWGNAREPHIAAEIERRYSIRPETRIFHAADEPRFLVSPDGLGVDFDGDLLGSEVKTGEEDLTPGAGHFEKLGYDLQCQWGMRVTGAQRWLFAWEQRFGVPGDFWAGDLRFFWIERDDKVIADLERRAREFLVEYDRVAAEPWTPDALDEVLDTHAVNYLRFLEEEKEAGEAKKREWAELLAAKKSQTSSMARITYSPGSTSEVTTVDLEAAKADAEGAAAFAALQAAQQAWDALCADRFTTTTTVTSRPTLRVTAVKPKDMKE